VPREKKPQLRRPQSQLLATGRDEDTISAGRACGLKDPGREENRYWRVREKNLNLFGESPNRAEKRGPGLG
jgi:hypothetical protein